MGLNNNWNSRFNSKERVKNPQGGIEKAGLSDKIQDKRGQFLVEPLARSRSEPDYKNNK